MYSFQQYQPRSSKSFLLAKIVNQQWQHYQHTLSIVDTRMAIFAKPVSLRAMIAYLEYKYCLRAFLEGSQHTLPANVSPVNGFNRSYNQKIKECISSLQ